MELDAATRIRGILVGSLLSAILSSSLVIAGAKAGIFPGVSPLVILFCWVLFGALFRDRLQGFLAMVQVTGSGGVAVAAGVVFIAPITQIVLSQKNMSVPPVDIAGLTLASLSGAFLGWGFMGLGTRRLLSRRELPAPEAVACDQLIRMAVDKPDERPRLATSLVPGLLAGAGISFLTNFHYLKEVVGSLRFRLSDPAAVITIPVSAAPVYPGIGALLTLPTALIIFTGSLLNSVIGGISTGMQMPGTTVRWVGGAAMAVGVIYNLVSYVVENFSGFAPGRTGAPREEALLTMDGRTRGRLYGSIGLGSLLLLINMFISGVSVAGFVVVGLLSLVLIFFLSELGGLLSLQVGSSASPVSGTVFMGLLVLSLAALLVGMEGVPGILVLVPVTVAICVAICSSNDTSQDYKTVQLGGFRVSPAYTGQLVGLLTGALVVPPTLWVAHASYGLGSAALPAPQASFFATVLDSLFLSGDIPVKPVLLGCGLGLLAVLLEVFGKRRGIILSSLAFAVGIYLPAVMGTGMLLGSMARFMATRRPGATTHSGILVAAGLITGDALFALLFGILLVAGVNTGFLQASATGGSLWGQILLLLMLLTIWINYRDKKPSA